MILQRQMSYQQARSMTDRLTVNPHRFRGAAHKATVRDVITNEVVGVYHLNGEIVTRETADWIVSSQYDRSVSVETITL